MVSFRSVAALALGLALMAGCQSTTQAPPPAVVEGPPPAEKVAAAKAAYSAMPGVIVGEVVLVRDGLAAVEGIDPKSVTKEDTLSYIDVTSNRVINTGKLKEVRPTRLVVNYSDVGDRAPREGDLCVKLK